MPPPATVPLATVHDRPVAVLTAGDRPVRAGIDTGGGSMLVRRRLADDLDLATGYGVEVGDTVFTTVEPPALVADARRLDTDGVATYAVDDDDVSLEAEHLDLVVPAAVLQRQHVVLDYPGGTLTLDDGPDRDSTGVSVHVDIDPATGLVVTDLEVDGEVVSVLLDSGAPCTTVAESALRRWLDAHPDWPVAAASVGPANMTGTPVEASNPMARLPEVGWAGFPVPAVAVAWRPDAVFEPLAHVFGRPVVGAVGGNVLRHFRIELDYGRGRMRLEQRRPAGEPDADLVGAVVLLDGEGGYLLGAAVTGLTDVRAGDRLVAVGGELCAALTLGQVIDRLRGEPGDRRRLTVERDDGIHELDAPVTRVV